MSNVCKFQVGTVFGVRNGVRISYWKITKAYISCEKPHYDVVACSKGGKEYRTKNGFWNIDKFLQESLNGFFVVARAVDPAKAAIDKGIEIGVKKRRFKHLKEEIENKTHELRGLILELAPSMVNEHDWFYSLTAEQIDNLWEDVDEIKNHRVFEIVKEVIRFRNASENDD
jgi:tRNA(Ile2) C34 agmatinyltransferase TiaS